MHVGQKLSSCKCFTMQLLQTVNESKTCQINTTSPKHKYKDSFTRLQIVFREELVNCKLVAPKGVCFEVPRQSGRGKHDLNKELLFILPHPEHTR